MSKVVRMCGNPDANLSVLLVNSNRKPQGRVVLRTWWRWERAETSDGFMDNRFIVQANC